MPPPRTLQLLEIRGGPSHYVACEPDWPISHLPIPNRYVETDAHTFGQKVKPPLGVLRLVSSHPVTFDRLRNTWLNVASPPALSASLKSQEGSFRTHELRQPRSTEGTCSCQGGARP